MQLTGKVALVTGSTSGIGLGIAEQLALAGATVILNGFGEVEHAKAIITATGATVDYHAADMSDPHQIAAMIEWAEAHYGAVDILVNNAGIQYTAPVESFPVEKWDAIIAINLSSVFHTSRAVLPVMQARHWGRIINIASVHGLVASKEKAAYVAAKHGVGWTKVIALENAITDHLQRHLRPGWVLTPLVQQQIDKRIAAGEDAETARLALLSEKQPAQAFVTPEQLGALVLFLCSEGGAQVRGAAWNMDGGWLAQ
ncbi:3-hydroxybutyrate dehydrogenase (plasmid) [Pseudomonas silvicola]|nr:3-hydroxybutyrate dehydrogenase [Pseudomonas silvicola]